MGLTVILFLYGRSLLPGKTFFHFDLLNEEYLPYANDVKYPSVTDHYAADQIQEMYPLLKWHAKQLKNGQLPLWDPYDQGGLPYHENSVRLPLHPFKFLLLILPADQVFDLSILLYFIFAFLAMVFYLSRYNLTSISIFFGAISWTLCAFFINNYPREGFLAPFVLIPFVITLLENLIYKHSIKTMLFFGAGLGLALLISDPVGLVIYFIIVIARFIGLLIWERKYFSKKLLGYFILGGITACLIATINILGIAHAYITCNRVYGGEMKYGLSSNWIVQLFSAMISVIINAFYPFFLGSKESLDLLKLVGLNFQYSVYFGFLGFLLIPFGFKTISKSSNRKWILILAILVLMTIFPLFLRVLKGRTMIILVFILIVSAVAGMEKILNMPFLKVKKLGKLFFIISIIIIIILLARHYLILHYYEYLHNKITLYIESKLSGDHLERYADWRLDAATRFLNLQLITNINNVFFIIVLFLFSSLILLGGYFNNSRFIVLALIFCLLPPIFYSATNVHIINKSKYPPPSLTPGMEILKTNIGHGRVLLMDIDKHGRLLLIKNQLDEFGINHLNGTGSYSPYRPSDLRVRSLNHPVFDELGITHLCWSKFSSIDTSIIKNIIYSGEIVIGEKKGNPSRCWIVSNLEEEKDPKDAIIQLREDNRPMGERIHYVDKLPNSYQQTSGLAGRAEIVSEKENEVNIISNVEKPGLLILSDTWYNGWIAEVDGIEKPILRVDGALRGVWLSPGKHYIKFVYRPKVFYVGVAISLTVVFSLIVFYLIYRLRNIYHTKKLKTR